MGIIHHILLENPIIALLLSVGIGCWIGKIKIVKFQLGGVAGSLLVAVVVSQLGVTISPEIKSLMFALFIYAVGVQSGPKFFSALNKTAIKEILLAVFLSAAGLVVVVVCAKLFHLDKGLAAGIAAGGLTQSAIIGTAGDAIAQLGLSAAETLKLQDNVAIGYAVTYIFGTLLTIILCTDILETIFRRSIRTDAVEAELKQNKEIGVKLFGGGSQHAIQDFITRVFNVNAKTAGKTIETIENQFKHEVTVEKVKRNGELVAFSSDTKLNANDEILVVGMRATVLSVVDKVGDFVYNPDEDMDLTFSTKNIVFSNKSIKQQTWGDFKSSHSLGKYHGVYIVGVSRMGTTLALTDSMLLKHGDVFQVYGSAKDVSSVAAELGYTVSTSYKTDYVYLGFGMVIGLLIGMLELKVKGVPITLGSGGGALLSGLIFGWLNAKRPKGGNIPTGAVEFLKDFGLTAFIAAVGLSAGMEALQTLKNSGIEIFIVGLLVTILPILLTMLFGWHVLKYRNIAIFSGALAGSRSANPAFGSILEKAGNSVPTVSFAITYAIANILLTLLGPLVVALV